MYAGYWMMGLVYFWTALLRLMLLVLDNRILLA
jgi:hypothetical protein